MQRKKTMVNKMRGYDGICVSTPKEITEETEMR